MTGLAMVGNYKTKSNPAPYVPKHLAKEFAELEAKKVKGCDKPWWALLTRVIDFENGAGQGANHRAVMPQILHAHSKRLRATGHRFSMFWHMH